MKETIEQEEAKDFEVPDELKRKIIDIMNDCPDIKKLGDKEYRIYNLRMYSLNRILKLHIIFRTPVFSRSHFLIKTRELSASWS